MVTMMDTSNSTTIQPDENLGPTLTSSFSGEEDNDVNSQHSSEECDYSDEYNGVMAAAMNSNDITAQLAAAGPIGMAAAAAIASAKVRKRHHGFETNPSIRKRQQNRLLRKLRKTIDEYSSRVGQQAVVIVAIPGSPSGGFKVFGAKPLEDVVKNMKQNIMEELETALANQAPPPSKEDPSLYELPPLIIDGIPTPVEKMTQAQLRAFIPLMLKYSTGRGKPGWGRESTRPPWWPNGLPWANVRMDARPEDEKQRISWTHALRQIVINCYKYHGREDLLPAFTDGEEGVSGTTVTITEENSSTGVIERGIATSVVTKAEPIVKEQQPTHFFLQTINSNDGTISIVQVDPNDSLITLPDGTTARLQGITAIQAEQGDGQAVAVEIDNLPEGAISQSGQLILTGEDGRGFPVSVSGMITVPPGSVYQTVVTNIDSGDAQATLTPMVHVLKVDEAQA